MSNKYNASGVWHSLESDEELIEKPCHKEKKRLGKNLVYFASQHEYEVYLALRTKYPLRAVTPHVSIELKPKSRYFKPINWTVDFLVTTRKTFFFVEAKGYTTREFLLKLSILDYFDNDKFDRLLLVFPNGSFKNNKLVAKYPALADKILPISKLRQSLKNGQIHALLCKH